jgi:hypothetical protein
VCSTPGAGGAAEPKREKELGKFSGKKSKAVAKGGAAGMSQYEILLKSGLAEDEIPAFADPHHWLGYFPPLGQEDLTSFGLHADWRRSFITTVRACVHDVCVAMCVLALVGAPARASCFSGATQSTDYCVLYRLWCRGAGTGRATTLCSN